MYLQPVRSWMDLCSPTSTSSASSLLLCTLRSIQTQITSAAQRSAGLTPVHRAEGRSWSSPERFQEPTETCFVGSALFSSLRRRCSCYAADIRGKTKYPTNQLTKSWTNTHSWVGLDTSVSAFPRWEKQELQVWGVTTFLCPAADGGMCTDEKNNDPTSSESPGDSVDDGKEESPTMAQPAKLLFHPWFFCTHGTYGHGSSTQRAGLIMSRLQLNHRKWDEERQITTTLLPPPVCMNDRFQRQQSSPEQRLRSPCLILGFCFAHFILYLSCVASFNDDKKKITNSLVSALLCTRLKKRECRLNIWRLSSA